MRITEQLDRAIEAALLARGQLPEANRILLQQMPAPGAQHYDGGIGGSVAWCDHHERNITACAKAYLEGRQDRICEGVPSPKVTDPTGDAVVATTAIFAGLRQVQRRVQRAADDLAWVLQWVAGQIVDDAVPDRSEALVELNAPKCQHHLRHGYLVDARGKNPTKVRCKGLEILACEYLLCRWCEDDVRGRYQETGERRLALEWELARASRKAGWLRIIDRERATEVTA